MRFRVLPALLVAAVLSACSPFGNQNAAPTAASAPTSAASQPTGAAAPTVSADATAVAAPTAAAGATAAAGNTSANYASADCPFEVPEGQTIECGYLTVPENRATGGDNTIKIAVGVFKTASNNPKPDPIVYLEGGPGGNALENWSENFERIFAPIAGDRDFIIFDQRGTGFSEPSLACQEYTDEAYAQLDKQLTIAESTELVNAALIECRERLAKEGVDFTGFNSIESAADLNDLRQALGYKEWNVYGISYGTRLALTAMREHPEGIRSVIIDSVAPPQDSETDTPAAADRAFRNFFDGCAADATCKQAYPDLEATFYKLVDDMNAKPVEQDVQDPEDGKSYKILLTGDSMIGILFFSLYQTSAIPLMPQAIANAAAGTDYSLLARLGYAQTSQNKSFSIGMLYAVRCNEEVPFNTPEELAAADDNFPKLRGLFDASNYTVICAAWQAGKAPDIENQPVTSDIPTLVTSGQYDPVTPPADAQDTARTLPRSYFFEFPGYGHGVTIDGDCPIGITTAFLDDPATKPDASCIDDLEGPAFAVPEGPVTLTSFENSDAGVKGVVPDSWEKAGPVAYTNRTGDLAILQQAVPGQDKQTTLGLLTQQFQLAEDPVSSGEYRSQRYTWSLYKIDVQGSPSDLALAEDNGTTYVVLLVSSKADQQELYDTLFIPALDALAPL